MVLIQFDTTRAFIANAQTLGLKTSSMSRRACSRFFVDLKAGHTSFTLELSSLPLSLHPTPLQQLCRDMRGVKSAKLGGKNGIIVRRDPWDESGRGVTGNFASKWAWVIRGCERLFKSTDYWRRLREKTPLFEGDGTKNEEYCGVVEEVF
ncbi:uncharacterized protein EAF01_009428 [Botrytis porri]|uniref:uncharacterized protein n=1 Tax=Botrytis porri TaxID=87229 RepID=UPI001900619A|nr:uncharacterized protein EAF01_009428 [Botrytis porri]KAF7895466.1 hypothetical protein EAF01_009428 [Botrytis porri]